MEELIAFLKKNKFSHVDNIEVLKFVFSDVSRKDGDTDIQSQDKRYFWDGKKDFGLHVSSLTWGDGVWKELNDLLIKNKDFVRVLYIGNTKCKQLSLASFSALQFLNLSENNNIVSLNLKGCGSLESLKTYACENLENIDLRTCEKLEKIDVSYCTKLSTINFPNRFLKLRLFHALKTKLENDLVEMGGVFEEKLREQLLAFLKFKGLLKEDELIAPNRYQVIFIGNTTAGKTELRLTLTGAERDPNEPVSTHGVHIFQHQMGNQEVFGYDFGGQDYYHALHLPFYDNNTLYVLVWGNFHEWTWGNGEPENFGMKTEMVKTEDDKTIEVQNVLYPLPYWLGSLLYQQGKPLHSKEENPPTSKKDQRKVEVIQNLRAGAQRFYLNFKALKNDASLDIGEMVDFDLSRDKKAVKAWLEERIKERGLLDTQPVSKTVFEFGKQLLTENKAFYTPKELTTKFKTELNISDEVEFKALAQSLQSNRLGFWKGGEKDFFIARIDLFSRHIHQILSKELATSDPNAGYFTQNDAQKRTGLNIAETKFIIDFLISENVIFKVEEQDKYLAPAYLHEPQNKADLLLLESFEEADCYWEFEGYFHSNIILQIIDDKKDNLIYDPKRTEYLLWKNTVLIYTHQEPEKPSREYLLIKLEYPNDTSKFTKPRLSLRRNKAKYVNDEDFRKCFDYLKQKLGVFEKVKCWVKSPVAEKGVPIYIPFQKIEECDAKQTGKYAHLVFFENMYYNRFEFKHFKEMGAGMPKKIFVAYSKSDDEFRVELRNHLRPYEKSGEIIVFDDRDLELGSMWDAELKKQLVECDIFVCLVSINMLNTSYVVDLEIPEAKRLTKQIIPVILSPCNWTEERFGLSEYSANDKGKVVMLSYQNFGSDNQSLQALGKFERAAKWTDLVSKILEISNSKHS